MKTYTLFASVYERPEDIIPGQRLAIALDMQLHSDVFIVQAASLEEAQSQFYKSGQFESFVELHFGRNLYTFYMDENGDFHRI